LISSTQRLRPRPADTSLRCITCAHRSFKTNHIPDPRARPSIILHGCQMPRLLQYNHRLLARSNSCHLRRLLDSSLPTYRRQSQTHRRMLIPEEVDQIQSFFFLLDRRWNFIWNGVKGEFRISSIPHFCPYRLHGGGISQIATLVDAIPAFDWLWVAKKRKNLCMAWKERW